jgi:hypothetical protein
MDNLIPSFQCHSYIMGAYEVPAKDPACFFQKIAGIWCASSFIISMVQSFKLLNFCDEKARLSLQLCSSWPPKTIRRPGDCFLLNLKGMFSPHHCGRAVQVIQRTDTRLFRDRPQNHPYYFLLSTLISWLDIHYISFESHWDSTIIYTWLRYRRFHNGSFEALNLLRSRKRMFMVCYFVKCCTFLKELLIKTTN